MGNVTKASGTSRFVHSFHTRPSRPRPQPARPVAETAGSLAASPVAGGRPRRPEPGRLRRAGQAVEERFEGELLGDVEVEAAAGVLDRGGAGARPGRVDLRRLAAQDVEAVAVEDDLLGVGG